MSFIMEYDRERLSQGDSQCIIKTQLCQDRTVLSLMCSHSVFYTWLRIPQYYSFAPVHFRLRKMVPDQNEAAKPAWLVITI